MIHPAGPCAGTAMVTMCRAAVMEELETWSVGDGLSDGLLAVRRTVAGFVVYDGEAAEPQLRRASPEEAVLSFLA